MTPSIIYGTAWKKEATAVLVRKALAAGYRAFDTANQKKHYSEDLAGLAIRESGLPRGELFLQSKFTFQEGQDHRLPYDPRAPFAEQVRSSFDKTLSHFSTDHLDSYLIHGPRSSAGMTDGDWQVWEVFEDLHAAGKIRAIGVSNVGPAHVLELSRARVRPMVVQNRCYAVRGWDRAVRELCAVHGILYQGFSLLTANPHVVEDETTAVIARRLGVTPEQLVLRFAKSLGILPLTGTTDELHMRQDLEAMRLELAEADARALAAL